jgi:uncharacterized protein (DUF697 family)/tellurite resistance protein
MIRSMAISEPEALASLRILVAVARADGTIHSDERKSLSAALESLTLPADVKVASLLDEDVDVDAQLALLTTDEARQQIYRSAFYMASADGACTPEEKALLEHLATALGVPGEERAALERTFVGRASIDPGPKDRHIKDGALRSSEVHATAIKYGAVAAALGAFPVPGLAIATDLGVIALQVKMIHDIAAMWGHPLDTAGAKSLLYAAGLGTGARLAISNLAKIVPGWGSVLGATTAFVSTYTLAKVIDTYFAEGDKAAPEQLRARFLATEAEARKVYADHGDVIIQSQRSAEATLASLTKELEEGRISRTDFEERVSRLV